MNFNELMRINRVKQNLSQKEAAALCGMSEAMYRQYELGKREPKYENRSKIIQGLKIPWSEVWDVTFSPETVIERTRDMIEQGALDDTAIMKLLRNCYNEVNLKMTGNEMVCIIDGSSSVSKQALDTLDKLLQSITKTYIEETKQDYNEAADSPAGS